MSRRDKLLKWTASVDRWLKKVIGEENAILYRFAQFALVAILLALLAGAAVSIVLLAIQAVLAVLAAFLFALPYLLVALAIAALSIYIHRSNTSKRSREVERPADVAGHRAQIRPAEANPAAEGVAIRQSLLATDQPARTRLESVLASLQRFDHRLELVITSAHYADVFGDNWVTVREFVESSQGRRLPDVSAKLVEIIILYKRAQEARWVPVNHDRIHAWWTEAARRRKWLAEAVRATADDSSQPEFRDDLKAAQSPDGSVVPPSPKAQAGTAPKFSSPPTLDELLGYYEWVEHRTGE